MSAHAILGPSSSKRWLTCTPSAALEATFPPSTSAYAEEGTLAHKIAELMLRKHYFIMKPSTYKVELAKLQKDPLFAPDMMGFVEGYVEQVKEAMTAARNYCSDPKIFLERRLDFSEYVPDGWGTGDVIIISDCQMEVIDLKYGKGVPVDAVDNPQCRLYGLGAVLEYQQLYDIEFVKMTVIQPRLEALSSETMPVWELLNWAEDFVKPRAAMAASGQGQFVPGDHCMFCRARATCSARSSTALAVQDFTDTPLPLLLPEDFASVLDKLPILEKWVEDFKKEVLRLAITEGLRIPGYKVVEGRSIRVITDPPALATRLIAAGYAPSAIYKKPELQGITELEKLVGKKVLPEMAGELMVKPAGSPKRAPITDKRPEMQSLEAAKLDFDADIESED